MKHWLGVHIAWLLLAACVGADDAGSRPATPGTLPPLSSRPTTALKGVPVPEFSAEPATGQAIAMPSAIPLRDARSVPIASQSPQVSVQIVSAPTANAGQPTEHEIIVRNVGQHTVEGVRVEEPLPPSTRYLGGEPWANRSSNSLVWELGNLEAGAERRIRVECLSSAEGEISWQARVTFSTLCGTTVRITRPKLEVKITGPESALVGETVVYHITLANTGTGPIRRILLRDRLPAGLHHPAGELLEAEVVGLEPGESRHVTLKTTAVKTGAFEHQLEAYADESMTKVKQAGTLQNSDLESIAKTTIRIIEPALEIRVGAPKICLIKCEGLVSIEVTNPGTAAARMVRVGTRIPEGTEFVAVDEGGRYNAASRTVSWSCPTLEPGGKKVWTMKIRGVGLGPTTCTAVAVAEPGLHAKGEASFSVEGIPALSLEVIDLDDPSPVDTDAQYEIRVVNQGTCPCTGIQIVAQLPEGMELREASAPTSYKVQVGQVQFSPFAKLATKADLIYRLKVRSKAAGDLRFRVQLTCDQLQQPVFKEESSRFYRP